MPLLIYASFSLRTFFRFKLIFIIHWYWPLYTICSNNITHIKFFSAMVANAIINSPLFLVCAVSILYLFIVFGYFHYWHPILICAMNIGGSTPKKKQRKNIFKKKSVSALQGATHIEVFPRNSENIIAGNWLWFVLWHSTFVKPLMVELFLSFYFNFLMLFQLRSRFPYPVSRFPNRFNHIAFLHFFHCCFH